MENVSFQIFIPAKEKFELTPNWIVYGLWFFSGAFLWAFDDYFSEHGDIRTYLVVCVGVVSFYYLILSWVRYEKLDGTLEGELTFTEDSIIINENVYKLTDISKLGFRFGDFYGERYWGSGNFNPNLKQGVHNAVLFKDKSGQEHETYFQQRFKNQYKDLYPFINEAVRVGAMTYYSAIDLIDAENVTKPENSRTTVC